VLLAAAAPLGLGLVALDLPRFAALAAANLTIAALLRPALAPAPAPLWLVLALAGFALCGPMGVFHPVPLVRLALTGL